MRACVWVSVCILRLLRLHKSRTSRAGSSQRRLGWRLRLWSGLKLKCLTTKGPLENGQHVWLYACISLSVFVRFNAKSQRQLLRQLKLSKANPKKKENENAPKTKFFGAKLAKCNRKTFANTCKLFKVLPVCRSVSASEWVSVNVSASVTGLNNFSVTVIIV